MAISTLLLGLFFIVVGIIVGFRAIRKPQEVNRMRLLQEKWGSVGTVIYYVGYVLFPLTIGAVLIWASSLGADLKMIFLS